MPWGWPSHTPPSRLGEYSPILGSLISIVGGLVATVFVAKYLVDLMDPSASKSKSVAAHANRLLKALGKGHVSLSGHEIQLACDLVNPADLYVTWDDIGGLDDVAESLKEAVVWPLRHRNVFQRSAVLQAPMGILLHGPPGCGKTMLAKAVAAECGLCFLNVQASSLLSLWSGEAEHLTAALFSLAHKLQPTVIFIDEIDCLLGSHLLSTMSQTSNTMRGQFLSLCDGLLTDPNSQVIVLGATNRPEAIDKATMRRLPLQFNITLPTSARRAAILRILLRGERVSPDVDVEHLARVTVARSGSDLKEMCRRAAMVALRELVAQRRALGFAVATEEEEEIAEEHGLRPLCMADFRTACPEYFSDDGELVD